MNENTEKSGNRGLVVTLVILCLMIVGLGIGVGIVFNQTVQPDDGDGIVLKNGETVSVAASDLYYYYVDLFENDPDFVSEDAVKGFNEKIEKTNNNNYKVTLAIWCAKYINEFGEGPTSATEYLKEYESIISANDLSDVVLIEYYAALRDYAAESGDSSEIELYNNLIEKLLKETAHVSIEVVG